MVSSMGQLALPEHFDDFFAPAGIAATGPAERFAQRAGDDIDLAHDAAIFVRPAAGFAQETRGVRVVDHRERVVFSSEIDNRIEAGDCAVH